MSEVEPETLSGKAEDDAHKFVGHVNILVAGRSGVGKSSLINSIFGQDFAATGQGRPVTTHTESYTKEGSPLTIFDTRGLEMEDYQKTLEDLRTLVCEYTTKADFNEHMHIAWVCVAEDGRRVEEGESDLVKMLAEHMPVLGVITKARADNGFEATVRPLMPEAENIIRVRAISEELDDGTVVRAMGLPELMKATGLLIPEAQRRAFIAAQKSAQKSALNHKVKEAQKAVAWASAAAVAAGASPIPFSDAALLVPIQVGMLAKISMAFELDVSTNLLSTLVTSAAGVTAATFAGRAVVSGLLKFIPGVGTLAGGAIAATTAGAMTMALGQAYIAALKEFGDNPPTEEQISESLIAQLKSRKKS